MAAAAPRFTPATLKFLRGLKRNNRREWFTAHREDYEAHVRAADGGDRRAAVDRFAGLRAGARRQSQSVDVPHPSRYTLLGKQGAVQDARRRGVPDAGPGEARRCGRLFPRRRPVRSGSAAGCMRRRCRSCKPSASTSRAMSGDCARLSNRPDSAGTLAGSKGDRLQRVPTRVPEGSRGRRVPEVPAVPRRLRVPADIGASPAFYSTLLSVFRQVVPLARFLNEPLPRLGADSRR